MARAKKNSTSSAATLPTMPAPEKMSPRLFTALRRQIEHLYLPHIRKSKAVLQKEQAAWAKEARTALFKMSRHKLEAYFLKHPGNLAKITGIELPEEYNTNAVHEFRERVAALRSEINAAELAYLAGNSAPAQALASKVQALIAEAQTTK